MLAGSVVTLFRAIWGTLAKKITNTWHSWGTTMRTMIDVIWHASELKLPLASEPIGSPRVVRWRNAAAALILAAIASPLATQRVLAAGPGDNEIRLGNTMPYSGPASAYGTIGKVIAAYFDKVNAEGGINGRKVNFISYDDVYNPTKTVELTRKLVEEDRVLLIFASLGTTTSAAVQPYMNSKKVPQLPDRRSHLCAVFAGEPS
jgi:hypothetical protein